MPYLFNAEGFALKLKEKTCEDGDFLLKQMFSSCSEEEREEKKRLFEICHRVMKAESLSDIEDLSIEDIAECIRIHDEYAKFYEKRDYAGEMCSKLLRRLKNSKTQRKRRVL